MKKIISALSAVVALVVPTAVSAQATLNEGQLLTSAGTSGLTAGAGSFTVYVEYIFGWIIGIVGFIAILGFLISAVLYFTAAGDEEKMEKAKNAMTYSIIGVVVALMGFVILTIVNNFLGTATQL